MAPQREDSPLIDKDELAPEGVSRMEMGAQSSSFIGDVEANPSSSCTSYWTKSTCITYGTIVAVSALVLFGKRGIHRIQVKTGHLVPTGPYRLVEAQEGSDFFSYYDFFDGPDSIGSAGYQTYVSRKKAEEIDIASTITEKNVMTGQNEEFVYMSSTPTEEGLRDSVRLEGKTRFNRGLFILDVRHMPDGCGVWPAFWLTDEAVWPDNGEVDILEGV